MATASNKIEPQKNASWEELYLNHPDPNVRRVQAAGYFASRVRAELDNAAKKDLCPHARLVYLVAAKMNLDEAIESLRVGLDSINADSDKET